MAPWGVRQGWSGVGEGVAAAAPLRDTRAAPLAEDPPDEAPPPRRPRALSPSLPNLPGDSAEARVPPAPWGDAARDGAAAGTTRARAKRARTAPVSVVASAATDGNVSGGGNGTAPCLLRVARWVDGALSTQYSSAVRTMPARREGKRRKAEKLLARHLSNTSSELLLRWRHVDKDNVEDDEDDDRPAATSFLEVTTTPPTPSRV